MRFARRPQQTRRRARAALASCLLCLAICPGASASSIAPLSTEASLARAGAACRGTVLGSKAARDQTTGTIWTETQVAVDEVFKGKLPRIVRVRYQGGSLDGEGEDCGLSPSLAPGESCIFLLAPDPGGAVRIVRGHAGARKLHLPDGRQHPAAWRELDRLRRHARGGPLKGADLTGASAEGSDYGASGSGTGVGGLTRDASGIPARFILSDQGREIPYLVDTSVLPPGLTEAQALQAVENALAAWTAVTSLRFRFDGLQAFGTSANSIAISDGRIRIQLHDTFNAINDEGVLGIGGRAWTTGDTAVFGTSGGYGGKVASQEFNRTTRGYVIIEHGETAMANPTHLAETLCHELGHVIGLAHSSEADPEGDPLLAQAMMYYFAHLDGRGAALGAYDPPIAQKAYPATNTPPWIAERVMYIVTAPGPPNGPNIPGVNEIDLHPFDLQEQPVAIATKSGTLLFSGSFSLSGSTLKCTPTAWYGDGTVDPASGSFYGRIFVRASDGTHGSPWMPVRVVGIYSDQYPGSGGDGVPDSWMETYFGNPNPAAGVDRGATEDYDRDGLTNRQEFRLGTNPTDASSRLAHLAYTGTELRWRARPYELYQPQRTGDFGTWENLLAPILVTSSTGVVALPVPGAGTRATFERILHVP